MASVGTSIIGRPRRLSRHRRAASSYTLICEEPVNSTNLKAASACSVASVIPWNWVLATPPALHGEGGK